MNLINLVPYVPARQCGLRASVVYVPTCQKSASFSFLRANVPIDVPIFQLGVPTCQKVCQFFRHSFYKMLSEVSILYYYIKNFTFYHILLHSTNSTFYRSYSYHMYMYRKEKLYYTSFLYFMTSFHIKEKCLEFFIFSYFFLCCSLVRNQNIERPSVRYK